jgi:cation transport ATPase
MHRLGIEVAMLTGDNRCILNPILAAAATALSSVTVLANALRLRRINVG